MQTDAQLIDETTFIGTTVWNDDGTLLAYDAYRFSSQEGDFVGYERLVYDVAAETTTVISRQNGLALSLPAEFLPDGRVTFAVSQFQEDPLMIDGRPYVRQVIYAQAVDGTGLAEPIGNAYYAPGCGGGRSLPTERGFWQEAGYNGDADHFRLTEYGLVLKSFCIGGEISRVDLEADSFEPFDVAMQSAQIAPGERFVGGVGDEAFNVIDLMTGETTAYLTQRPIDQFTWYDDIIIYYSSKTFIEDQATGLGEDSSIPTVPVYDLAIHRYDLTTGDDSVIYTSQGHSIPRLSITPDGAGLVFSELGLLDDWLEAVRSGAYDRSDPQQNYELYQNFQMPVVLLPLDNPNDVQIIGVNHYEHTIKP
jgi:hypothetical protein